MLNSTYPSQVSTITPNQEGNLPLKFALPCSVQHEWKIWDKSKSLEKRSGFKPSSTSSYVILGWLLKLSEPQLEIGLMKKMLHLSVKHWAAEKLSKNPIANNDIISLYLFVYASLSLIYFYFASPEVKDCPIHLCVPSVCNTEETRKSCVRKALSTMSIIMTFLNLDIKPPTFVTSHKSYAKHAKTQFKFPKLFIVIHNLYL